MANLSGNRSLYDPPPTEETTPSDQTDEWARSPERKGWVTWDKHQGQISSLVNSVQTGQISEEGALNLSRRVKGLAPFILPAIGQRKSAMEGNKLIGKYVNEGSPASVEQMGPPTEEGQYGAREIPAVPAQRNFQGLSDAYVQRGQWDLAKQAREAGGLDKRVAGAGEVTSVKLGAAYSDPNSYDPLDLVGKHGTAKAKSIYGGMYNNAKALEKISYTDRGGVERQEIVPRTAIPETGRKDASYKQVHKDVIATGEGFQKTMALENGIDSLDQLFEKNPTSVRDATGNVKNIDLATYLKGEDARNATAIIAGIEAEVIRKNAGLTQTASELATTKAMLARTAGFSAADFEKAFRRLQTTYADEKRLAFNKLGAEGKAIAAERFNMNPDKTAWEIRKEARKNTGQPLTPAQQRARSLLDKL